MLMLTKIVSGLLKGIVVGVAVAILMRRRAHRM